MGEILEISIFGNVFLFENQFTDIELNQLDGFTKSFFPNKQIANIDNMINKYILEVERNLQIRLTLVSITGVIAI